MIEGIKIIKKKNIKLLGIDIVSAPIERTLVIHPSETKFAVDVHQFKLMKSEEQKEATKEDIMKKLFNVGEI